MRNLAAILTIFLLGTVLSLSLWSAKADQPKPDKAASEANENVEVRVARAHLELAKLDLRRAMEGNKNIPNMFPAEFIETLKLHIVIDEAQLEQCLIGEDADSHEICIRSAESAVKIAEADMKRKRALHNRASTTDTALDAERAAMIVRIAKLNLDRAQNLESSESAVTHLQWQIDDLRHQLLELQMQFAARPGI